MLERPSKIKYKCNFLISIFQTDKNPNAYFTLQKKLQHFTFYFNLELQKKITIVLAKFDIYLI